MSLIDEAVEMLEAGRPLTSWGGRRIVRLERLGGAPLYDLTVHVDGQLRESERFTDAGEAARFFRVVAGRAALLEAVCVHRYAHLFPIGSSLEWGLPLRERVRGARQAV